MTLDERQKHLLDNGLARLYRGRLIPVIRGAEGDGEGGTAGNSDGGSASGEGSAGSAGGGESRTFTQADVDRIVQERLARARTTPPADYDDLKAKAARLDEMEAKNKSELERAQERAAAAERERDEARLSAQETRLQNAIIGAASGKLADPTDAVALIDRAAVEFSDDGSPKNVDTLITSLLATKPHLAAGGARGSSADQGARGGGANAISRDQLKTMSPDQIVKAQHEGLLDHLLKG